MLIDFYVRVHIYCSYSSSSFVFVSATETKVPDKPIRRQFRAQHNFYRLASCRKRKQRSSISPGTTFTWTPVCTIHTKSCTLYLSNIFLYLEQLRASAGRGEAPLVNSTSTTFWNVTHHARRKGFSYTFSWRFACTIRYFPKSVFNVCHLDLPTTFRELCVTLFMLTTYYISFYLARFLCFCIGSILRFVVALQVRFLVDP